MNTPAILIEKCPACDANVRYLGTSSTLVGYGSFAPGHDHDDNCKMQMYMCDNSHEIGIRLQNVCPAEGCDWVGKTDCFCSPLGIRVYDPKTKAVIHTSNPTAPASV